MVAFIVPRDLLARYGISAPGPVLVLLPFELDIESLLDYMSPGSEDLQELEDLLSL
jgi:hypothetical protein